ncbi:predicted protein [Lichtheimia corymbifera JMRC:FSU:9682]|uniref:Uncharacterized protein n=1 Tax=Lichtheimia corymbifera JMRC:FSU:9682 TaxID=1263082 RepID=A0A068S7H4_9FUNG|nr:predicted protein [Lichtheimia corymbifera JMRC:FSU:9682]
MIEPRSWELDPALKHSSTSRRSNSLGNVGGSYTIKPCKTNPTITTIIISETKHKVLQAGLYSRHGAFEMTHASWWGVRQWNYVGGSSITMRK